MESRFEVRGCVFKELGPVSITHGVDSVVAATSKWTFQNATFMDAYVGAKLVIAGAANARNNGTHIIAEVIDPNTIVTKDPPGVLVNESFGGGVTQSVTLDPCWAVSSPATQIQITFDDGTIIQTNGDDAEELLENLRSTVRQAEMRGITTGGPHKWTFANKGASVGQVLENI